MSDAKDNSTNPPGGSGLGVPALAGPGGSAEVGDRLKPGLQAETAEGGSPAAIVMQDITIGSLRQPGIVVAEGVNWRVERGDFWAVAGLHGTGKSDLMMLAGGVMPPLSGSYEFLGEPMPIFAEERLAHRLKLGLVFDGGRLFNSLTVEENIALPLRYHRNLSAAEAGPQLGALLDLLELTPFVGTHPGSIGRNWQRRVALARALVLRPEVLLLDNPLTSLDLRHRQWWLNFLGELSRGHRFCDGRPLTIAVTTDSFRDWQGCARQFAMLAGRRFTALGDWPALTPGNDPLVRELMGGEARTFDPAKQI